MLCYQVTVSDSHSFNNLPFVLIGGAGGALKQGRYMDFKGASNNDLYLALFQAFGVAKESFGDAKYTNGALTNLLA